MACFSAMRLIPTLRGHISHVVRVRPKEEVIGVDAPPNVAAVAHKDVVSDRAAMEAVGLPVRSVGPPLMPELSIAARTK